VRKEKEVKIKEEKCEEMREEPCHGEKCGEICVKGTKMRENVGKLREKREKLREMRDMLEKRQIFGTVPLVSLCSTCQREKV
jgi:hypothetical protein